MITASDNVDSPRKRSRVSELDHGWTGWNWVDRTTTCTSEENSRQDFHTTYEQLELLGEGGFGSVFAGIRGEDHFPVAIKRIHRDRGHLARRWADTPSSGGDHAENGQRIRGEICSHCTAWFLRFGPGAHPGSGTSWPLPGPLGIYQSHFLQEAAGGGEPLSSSFFYILYSNYVYTFHFFIFM